MSDKKKILIVEDEQDISVYLAALFDDNGYETVTALDGLKGFDMAKTEKPDLITLDMAMPEQSGVRLFRKFREDPEILKIPVVIITGIGEDMETFFAKLKGFPSPEGFMAKPIEADALLKMVGDILAD